MPSPLYYLHAQQENLLVLDYWMGLFWSHACAPVRGDKIINYTHKINNTTVGTWKHFIQSQNCGTLVCGDFNFYLR